MSDFAQILKEEQDFRSELKRRIFAELDKNNIPYKYSKGGWLSNENFTVNGTAYYFKTKYLETHLFGLRSWYMDGVDRCVNETLRYIAKTMV